MIQAVQGYFQEGRFVSQQQNVIPDYVEVYVVITNKAVLSEKTKAQKQRQAFERFTQVIASAEPLSEEFDEIISQGIGIRGEFEISDFNRIEALQFITWAKSFDSRQHGSKH